MMGAKLFKAPSKADIEAAMQQRPSPKHKENEMSEIPEDIKCEAERLCPLFVSGQSVHTANTDAINAIAQAILAERNRCAKIAEDFEVKYAQERDSHVHGSPEHYMNNSGSYAAMDIAAAIRG